MNLLLTYYIEKNSIPEWRANFSSGAAKLTMYAYKGTNGRSLTSMIKIFQNLEEVENKPRSEWPRKDTTGQEIHKQYTTPMLETKLFYRENGIFHKTAKGIEYRKFIDTKLGKEEEWLINYLFLLDAFILNRENYLITRSNDIKNIYLKVLPEDYVDNVTFDFLKNSVSIKKFEELVQEDYLFLNSFYRDSEFLKLFYEASNEERLELKKYVLQNHNSQTYNCCISKKYKPGGNYNVNMIKEDAKVYCFSKLISKVKYSNFEQTIKEIIELYSNYFYFNKNTVLQFSLKNKNIIEPILMNIYNVEELEDYEEEIEQDGKIIDTTNTDLSDRPEPRIDDTTLSGKQQLKAIFTMRKKIARERSNYKCELEEYKGCRYFTSKSTNQNYVEVHHFIPREFRNIFENSVDVLANYITLCPRCHKMIHLAIDRERVDVIRYIYNKRKGRLVACGLDVELEEIMQYYNVEEK